MILADQNPVYTNMEQANMPTHTHAHCCLSFMKQIQAVELRCELCRAPEQKQAGTACLQMI